MLLPLKLALAALAGAALTHFLENRVRRTPRLGQTRDLTPTFTILVTVTVKEDMLEEFLDVMMEDVIGALERENGGCIRFDLLRDPNTANKFIFYEMYKNPAALGFHMQQPHYKRYARFKERGGILSQDALVMEGLMGADM